MTEQQVGDCKTDGNTEADNQAATLVDEHRDFLMRIEGRSRRGYSILGVSSLLAVVIVFLASGVKLISWTAIILAPGVLFLALILGRRFGLARQDVDLILQIEAYCEREDVSPDMLLDAIAKSGRFEFVRKVTCPVAPSETITSNRVLVG